MAIRIDTKKPDIKAIRGKGKTGGATATSQAVGAGRGAGEGPMDRFGGVGRVIGGSAPSDLISAHGPGERVTMPLTEWEIADINRDQFLRVAKERMDAYRNLPDPWKKKVDEWGQKVGKEMQYSLASAIMKKKS